MTRLLAILLCLTNSCFAQTRFTAFNQQQADRDKEEFKTICRQLGSNTTRTKNEIEGDKRIIAFLNEFYNKDLSVNEIARLLSKFKLSGRPDSTNLGGAVHFTQRVNAEYSNLRTEIIFTTFQGQVVYKSIFIETKSKSYCLDTVPSTYLGFSDIKYLEDHCFPYIDFPIRYFMHWIPFRTDTALIQKAGHLQTNLYKLFPTDSAVINKMVWADYIEYRIGGTLYYLRSFVKAADTGLLFQFLYSPNHIIALYTMEALIYLQETGRVTLPVDITQKMEELKNSDIVIKTMRFDVGGIAVYKNLNVSKSAIVHKYNKLLSVN